MRPIWHGPASCAARRGGNVGGGGRPYRHGDLGQAEIDLATLGDQALVGQFVQAAACHDDDIGVLMPRQPVGDRLRCFAHRGPCSATIWMPVSRSYFAASAWKAAVKPPDVTTCNSRTFAGFVSRASAGRQRHSAPAAMPAPARRGAASRFETLEIGLPSYLSSGRPARLRVLVVTVSCRGRGLSHRALRGTKPHMGRFDQMQ